MVKNAFANLCRGGAVAFVALLLPPFLTRILSKDAYGTWLLILQLSTFVSFFDFGIQTAVGRYIAHCNELGDTNQRDSIVSTSLAILTASGAVATGGLFLLSWQLPSLFHNMPAELHQDARLALLYVGGSLAFTLPFTVLGGIFIGLQRYDILAWIIGSSKIIGAIFVVLIANYTKSIVSMAIVLAISNISTYLWMFLVYRRSPASVNFSLKLVTRESAKEIIDYCFGLFIWSIGMLLITGLDTTIVGYFDYKSVSYYAVASSVVVFIAGVQGSAFSALMPVAAKGANKDPKILGELLISSTRISVLTSMILGLTLFTFGEDILTRWINVEYAINSIFVLKLLVIANVIRSSLIPYSVILIGTGEQRLVTKSPLIEGVINLVVSVIATYILGMYGAALGTIVGSLALWLMCIFDNMPRTQKIYFNKNKFMKKALLKPILSILIPTSITYFISSIFSMNSNLVTLFLWSMSCMLIFMTSIFLIGINKVERIKIFIAAKNLCR